MRGRVGIDGGDAEGQPLPRIEPDHRKSLVLVGVLFPFRFVRPITKTGETCHLHQPALEDLEAVLEKVDTPVKENPA